MSLYVQARLSTFVSNDLRMYFFSSRQEAHRKQIRMLKNEKSPRIVASKDESNGLHPDSRAFSC